MDYEDARQDIVGHVFPLWVVQYPTYPLIPPNQQPPDLADQATPFVMMHINYVFGRQASIEASNPVKRRAGYITFEIFSREYSGSTTMTQIADFLTETMEVQTIGGVITRAATLMPSSDFKGWTKLPLRVPFYFDSIN